MKVTEDFEDDEIAISNEGGPVIAEASITPRRSPSNSQPYKPQMAKALVILLMCLPQGWSLFQIMKSQRLGD